MSDKLTIEGIQAHPLYKKRVETGWDGVEDIWFKFGPLEVLFGYPDEDGVCDWSFSIDGDKLPSPLRPKTWHDLELLCRPAGKPMEDDTYGIMRSACKHADTCLKNLSGAVDWGKTFDLDIGSLNLAMLLLPKAIDRAGGRPDPMKPEAPTKEQTDG